MSVQHQELAAGRWHELSLLEQMAHIGSEVERTLKWQVKQHPEYATKACERALELFDLTLADPKHRHRLKELARARELWVDYCYGANQWGSTAQSWQAYFSPFTWAAQRHR